MKNKELTKLEYIYNIILFAITIITIILLVKPIFSLIKYSFLFIIGSITVKSLSLLIGIELATLGFLFIPIMISLILLSLITHIYLIMKAIVLRKVNKRIPKVLDLLYLIILSIIIVIASGFYSHQTLTYIPLCGVYINIILLIIIYIRKRKKNNKK